MQYRAISCRTMKFYPAYPSSFYYFYLDVEYMMSDCQLAARLNAECRIAWGQLAEYCIVLDCSPIKGHCWNTSWPEKPLCPNANPVCRLLDDILSAPFLSHSLFTRKQAMAAKRLNSFWAKENRNIPLKSVSDHTHTNNPYIWSLTAYFAMYN